jgi:glutamine synthetase
MAAKLADRGMVLSCAVENEFSLARQVDGRYVPIDNSLCFSTVGMTAAAEVTDALVLALENQGIEVEQYYPELGHGQQELSVRHAPALRAADNMVWYRETARGVAWRQGLWASLAPKPIPDQAGNGAHLHASLWEAGPDGQPDGRNVLHDTGDPRGLSELAYHWIAGLLAHLPALVALTCASVNSYRRLVPQWTTGRLRCASPRACGGSRRPRPTWS